MGAAPLPALFTAPGFSELPGGALCKPPAFCRAQASSLYNSGSRALVFVLRVVLYCPTPPSQTIWPAIPTNGRQDKLQVGGVRGLHAHEGNPALFHTASHPGGLVGCSEFKCVAVERFRVANGACHKLLLVGPRLRRPSEGMLGIRKGEERSND